jgi:hypothetical protein
MKGTTMTLYNVHLYREVRLFFQGIEANTAEEAAAKAAHLDTADADFIASCNRANLAAHVALAGEDFSTAVSIHFERSLRQASPDLLAALQYALEYLKANDDGEDDIAARIAAAEAAIAKATDGTTS